MTDTLVLQYAANGQVITANEITINEVFMGQAAAGRRRRLSAGSLQIDFSVNCGGASKCGATKTAVSAMVNNAATAASFALAVVDAVAQARPHAPLVGAAPLVQPP